jgi:glycosyltransferase involved in cell wall biosynthesis
MRILSIVTLVTPTGDYGGPLRVAVNQAHALQERGHEVTLVAAHQGFAGPPPTHLGAVPARLFRARRVAPRTGFAGLSAPGMLTYLLRALPDHDVVHVHVARDLVTLPAALLAALRGVPYVLQSHGMVDASSSLLARLGDPLLTVRALSRAARVLYLTPTEREDLTTLLGGTDTLQHLPNGVPEADRTADATTPEVLYLARLTARKRPTLVVDVADELHEEFPAARYRIVGPDAGADVAWEGPLDPDRTLDRMSTAGIFVLPSVDEPYPMSVLEAMSVGLPVVVTDTCGLAPLVARTGAGLVVDASRPSLVAAVRSLLADPSAAQRMGRTGQEVARRELGMAAIAETLEEVYASCSTRRR